MNAIRNAKVFTGNVSDWEQQTPPALKRMNVIVIFYRTLGPTREPMSAPGTSYSQKKRDLKIPFLARIKSETIFSQRLFS